MVNWYTMKQAKTHTRIYKKKKTVKLINHGNRHGELNSILLTKRLINYQNVCIVTGFI